jgi:hypothetical protein
VGAYPYRVLANLVVAGFRMKSVGYSGSHRSDMVGTHEGNQSLILIRESVILSRVDMFVAPPA